MMYKMMLLSLLLVNGCYTQETKDLAVKVNSQVKVLRKISMPRDMSPAGKAAFENAFAETETRTAQLVEVLDR